MIVKESTIGALESFVIYYRTTGEAVMEKRNVPTEHSEGCAFVCVEA